MIGKTYCTILYSKIPSRPHLNLAEIILIIAEYNFFNNIIRTHDYSVACMQAESAYLSALRAVDNFKETEGGISKHELLQFTEEVRELHTLQFMN